MMNIPGELYLGIDIGSISVKLALLDERQNILTTSYHRLKGQPLNTVHQALKQLLKQVDPHHIQRVGVTGSGGRLVGHLLQAEMVNEVIAQAEAVIHLHPEVRTVIEIGGEDSKLILLGKDHSITDFAMNTICAAGTGSFLDQQATRLGVSIEDEFGELALRSQHPPRIAGRCSVFAKSDMIHLQQEATPIWDIAAGLCHAMARNFKSNIARGKEFIKPIAFQGGVAANQGMVQAFINTLELEPGELIIPREFACIGAIGAALVVKRQTGVKSETPFPGLAALEDHIKNRSYQPQGLDPLTTHTPLSQPRSIIYSLPADAAKIEAYLGIDVGSISTNVVIIDKDRRVLAKRYLMTAGQPIEAVRRGIQEVGQEVGHQVRIMGVGTTGSGRYLIGDFVGADIVKNEITAQARAAMDIDPEVDTIFEIGGQDSKYISFENGVVVDFEMNKVCAAGTGSFLEEQAEKLGIQIKQEFGQLALSSLAPAQLGERCTVFMESDLNHHQQQGAAKDNLVAGLSYSIVYNYLNRVVGDRRVGRRIFLQGGVAANQGVVAAFNKVTGKQITVPPHHDVTGAIGVAIIAQEERDWATSRFKGFDLSQRRYDLESFECNSCSNMCEIKRVTLEGESPLHYGSRCEKYNLKKGKSGGNPLTNLFKERERRMLAAYQPQAGQLRDSAPSVGIPRCLFFYEQYPFWQAFFTELGFKVILSEPTNKAIIHQGLESVSAETCFPIKLAHGHVLNLLDKGIDYLFLPSIINLKQDNPRLKQSQTCPYIQSIPYIIKSAIDVEKQGVSWVRPILHFKEGRKYIEKALIKELGAKLGLRAEKIKTALGRAEKYQDDFQRAIERRGREILDNLKPSDQGLVIISRPYNGYDLGMNLNLPKKLNSLGAIAIPIDFLPLKQVDLSHNWPDLYWRYGQKIMAAAEIIRQYDNLNAVYITNFGCGPDSFITQFFRKQMGDKPYLQLEIDEHSADAGVITRCEAFLDSIRNQKAKLTAPRAAVTKPHRNPALVAKNERTIYIPHMSDAVFAICAAFRACGIKAEVLPESDEESISLGRQVTSGRECYPYILTVGDFIKKLKQPGFDPHSSAFFMPSTDGPCRFGLYNRYQSIIIEDLGYKNVAFISPNQGNARDYYSEFDVFSSKFYRIVWSGIIAIEYLEKLAREIRPYELQKGETDRVYRQCLDEVFHAIIQDDLIPTLKRSAEKLTAVKTDFQQPKPVIGIIGEIYIRSNRFANNNIISKIEELGGEAHLSPTQEWIKFVNYIQKRDSWKKNDYQGLIKCLITDVFQNYDEFRVSKLFKGKVKRRHEPSTGKILKYSAPFIHNSFHTEALLSVGRAAAFAQDHTAGIINVKPFNCMPGTVTTAILTRIKRECNGIPCLDLVYDGLQETNSQIRLEAFMYQARKYHKATRKV
jgi:predicted CoA-substrate-specific enzyme activase